MPIKAPTELEKIARQVRKDAITMIYEAGSGHPGGSLSSTDILVALYFGGVLRYDPKKPNWPDRDRFVLSAGHYCPALYAVLAKAGYFPKDDLSTYAALGSALQAHPHNLSLPGIETSSGALGQGLSQAVGMALAGKMDNASWQVFCLLSDGDQDEGQTWEAVMLAAKYKLDNLIAIIDKNGIQIDGTTDQIMPLGDLAAKYRSFGWEAVEVDGHDTGGLIREIGGIREIRGKPKAVIARTIFGKGVSFMERNYAWHSKAPNKEELEKALEEMK
ncbi:transketolase [Candidatus Shapirobacteria bacterium]|nr:transketolase [Candidatus Shapirobacteria bacterium]